MPMYTRGELHGKIQTLELEKTQLLHALMTLSKLLPDDATEARDVVKRTLASHNLFWRDTPGPVNPDH